ncbi:OST-HTH/LOTUS domain-containing protein [Phycicoccus sp. CSK15P-2]|nr:OST-HTH/LOTUS domain-containing protein [Phycicoccus sp. CSK15P-2]
MHLKEHGVQVYGFGDAKTPAPFQSACTRFLVLDRLSAPSGDDDEDGARSRSASGGRGGTARSTTRKTAAQTAGKSTAKAAEKSADTTPDKGSERSAAATDPAPTERASRSQLRQDAKLVALLRRAVDSASDDSGWAKIGTVGQRISNQSSFDARNYGYAKLSKLIETTDLFEIRDPGTPDMAVRDPHAG